MEKQAKTRKRKVPRRLLFVMPLLLFLAVAGLAVWGMVTAYATPEQSSLQAVEGYLESLRVGDFERINRESGFTPSPLCGWRNYDDHLRALYGDDFEALAIAEPESSGDGAQVYAVSQDGTPLAQIHAVPQEGDWQVFTDIAADYQPYTIVAPAHLQVTVNGLAMSPDDVVQTRAVDGYGELPEDAGAPHLLTYETPPLFTQPEVTATSGLVAWEDDTRLATVTLPVQDEALDTIVTDTFAQYAGYMAGDDDWEDLEPLLWPGATQPEPTGLALEQIAIRDVTLWAENAFSAVVDYQSVDPDDDEETPPVPDALTMHFIQVDGDWYWVA